MHNIWRMAYIAYIALVLQFNSSCNTRSLGYNGDCHADSEVSGSVSVKVSAGHLHKTRLVKQSVHNPGSCATLDTMVILWTVFSYIDGSTIIKHLLVAFISHNLVVRFKQFFANRSSNHWKTMHWSVLCMAWWGKWMRIKSIMKRFGPNIPFNPWIFIKEFPIYCDDLVYRTRTSSDGSEPLTHVYGL